MEPLLSNKGVNLGGVGGVATPPTFGLGVFAWGLTPPTFRLNFFDICLVLDISSDLLMESSIRCYLGGPLFLVEP